MKTKIRVLFLGLPKGKDTDNWFKFTENPTMPFHAGRFGVERLAKDYAEKINKFNSDDVELTGFNVVRTKEELALIEDEIKQDAGVLMFILDCYCGSVASRVIDYGMPVIYVVAQDGPYSPIPFLQFYSAAAASGRQTVLPVLSSDINDIGRKIAVIKCIEKLKRSKLLFSTQKGALGSDEWDGNNNWSDNPITGIYPPPAEAYAREARFFSLAPPSEEDTRLYREKYGIDVKTISSDRLIEAYESIGDRDAQILARQWIDNTDMMYEPIEKDVVESARLYYGIKKVMDEENAQAITETGLCMGTGKYPLPCIAFSQLNSEGLFGICETDMSSSISMMMLGYLTDQPGFMGHGHLDTSRSLFGLSHDSCPTKLAGCYGRECEHYELHNHCGLFKSTCTTVRMKLGQKVTVVCLEPFVRMRVFTGVVDHNMDPNRVDRTSVAIKVKDAKKLQRIWFNNWEYNDFIRHKVLFYGDWVDEIRDLGQLLGFEVVVEDE